MNPNDAIIIPLTFGRARIVFMDTGFGLPSYKSEFW